MASSGASCRRPPPPHSRQWEYLDTCRAAAPELRDIHLLICAPTVGFSEPPAPWMSGIPGGAAPTSLNEIPRQRKRPVIIDIFVLSARIQMHPRSKLTVPMSHLIG